MCQVEANSSAVKLACTVCVAVFELSHSIPDKTHISLHYTDLARTVDCTRFAKSQKGSENVLMSDEMKSQIVMMPPTNGFFFYPVVLNVFKNPF